MVYVVIVVAWVLIGAAVGLAEARRGHWRHSWVVAAVMGPFAIALARERRRFAPPSPTVLTRGRAHRGPVDLLVGFDGSSNALEAATLAIGLFGPQVRRVTLATVLDVESAAPHAGSALYSEPWPEQPAARDALEAAVTSIEAEHGIEAGSVILAGAPAEALERYALEGGYEVLVIGCRGEGLSKRLLGSCASTLAARTEVPVMLIPAAAAPPGASAPTASHAPAST